jgi:hypothetical protein
MSDEEQKTRIDRMKAIYRDFFSKLSLLKNKKEQILNAYERELVTRTQEQLRHELDKPSV